MKQYSFLKTSKALSQGLLLGALCVSSALFADDTEVFFGHASDAVDSNPNILFILDSSGSMNNRDGGPTSRMERLKEAMYALIDQSSSFNVGFMGFSGHQQGGSVRYPIGYLEGAVDTECPDTGCPDELIVARPRQSTDDAYEKLNSGEVIVGTNSLFLGEYKENTVPDAPPPDQPVIDDVAELEETVQEYYEYNDPVSTNQRLHQFNYPNHQHAWNGLVPTSSYSPSEVGYRFTNVNIPIGAVVTNAYIEFTNKSSALGDVSLYVSGEASTSPDFYQGSPSATSPLQLDSRVKTNSVVSWIDVPAQAAGSAQQTPALTDIVAEIISLPNWVSGNSLSFIIDSISQENTNTAYRDFHAWALDPSARPKLHYSYYIPAGSGTITQSASQYTYEAVNPTDNTVTTRYDLNATESIFDFDVGHDPGFLAFKFNNLDIPDGAVIQDAYFELEASNVAGSFTANISAELSGNPMDYEVGDDQRDRQSTEAFETMNMVEGYISSPSIASVINEVLALPDWAPGNPISIHVRPGAGYDHDLDSISVDTSNAPDAQKPALIINYTTDSTSTATAEEKSVLTAIRFPDLHVPPSAQIQSAVIEFHSNAANAESATLQIRAEATSNAAPFDASNTKELSDKLPNLTTAGASWTVDPWDTIGNSFTSVDVKSIVQELVNQSDWCGGNAVSMLMQGTGIREAVAFDQSSVNSPTLRVTYASDSVPEGAYCSNRSAVLSISSNSDDATESDTNKEVDLSANTLDLQTVDVGSKSLGLRFRGVQLPQGATVVSAVLELSAASDIAGGNGIEIQVENTDDSLPLEPTPEQISGRSWSATKVNWNALPAAAAGANLFSPDITELVSSTVTRSGWNNGNAITFRLRSTGAGTDQTSFHSFEGQEALAPRLIVYYQGERSIPSALFKENLKNAIGELVAQDGTPIVDVLYEGALYMKGMPVDYGKRRGSQKYIDRNSRVSHPFSWHANL